jgi:uncharacterized protein
MTNRLTRTYPHGVPCWVDRTVVDLDAATRFYGELFGWQFHTVSPADAPFEYRVASLDGQDVAAVGASQTDNGWSTYIAIDDADATAAAVTSAGGRVDAEPMDVGPAGRMAVCTDPTGARFLLWQAGQRPGVQRANDPGCWNFSHLRTREPAAVQPFYEQVFGWRFAELPGGGDGGWIQVPGYGQHLHDTVDPDIFERQANAPEGFADVVAGVETVAADDPHTGWSIVFTVADRDDAAATAERLGASVLSREDTMWTKTALIADPAGAVLTLSQFAPPD